MEKKYRCHIFLIMASLLGGCALGPLERTVRDFESNEGLSEVVVLGNRTFNPFSLSKARLANPAAEPNRLYVRARTDDYAVQDFLSKRYPLAQTTPMDYEILEGGVEYDDPELDERHQSGWIYLVVTIPEAEDLRSRGVIVDVLETLFVDAATLESVASANASVETRSPADELNQPGRWARERPKGKVYLWDSVNGVYVPLPKVRVVANQWMVEVSDMTDSEGNYSISHTFDGIMGEAMFPLMVARPS